MSGHDFIDGWALWQEHRPQSAEDWVGVAKRCAADPDFDYTQSSPIFGAAFLLAQELGGARGEERMSGGNYPGSITNLRETYEAVVRCLIANGARRQELGSGWWFGGVAIQEEATLGVAFEQLLDACGIDQRDAIEDEPQEYWG